MPATIFLPSSKHMPTIISFLSTTAKPNFITRKQRNYNYHHLLLVSKQIQRPLPPPFQQDARLAMRSHSPLTSKLMCLQSSYSSGSGVCCRSMPTGYLMFAIASPCCEQVCPPPPCSPWQECTFVTICSLPVRTWTQAILVPTG